MQLMRIVLAGTLLFGVGCELPEEGDLATDERVEATDLDSTDYAIDDTMALDSDISEAVVDEAESTALLEEGDADVLGGGGGGKKKWWVCVYCYEDDDDKGKGKGNGKDECYCGVDKKKNEARDEAKDECEDKHDDKDCEYEKCWSFKH